MLALDDTPLPTVVVQAVRVAAGGGAQPGLLGEFFEIKGYDNPLLPKISRGAGRLIHKLSPFHLSGPGYKSRN